MVLLDMLVHMTTGTRDKDKSDDSSKTPRAGSVQSEPATTGPLLYVAHLNHVLRGQESDEDANFVKGLVDRLGLNATVASIDVAEVASKKRQGIEETAREVRYEFLLRLALEAGCDRIAVGHTMNDQAETFLMRLIRGAGLRGLSAMRPVSLVPTSEALTSKQHSQIEMPAQDRQSSYRKGFEENRVPQLIRPLLCITRDEVLEYCRERGLEYRIDATNSSSDYTRTVVRHQILPALTVINPRIIESIFRATESIAGDEDVLNDLAASALAQARTEANSTGESRIGSYSVSAILKQSSGMRRRILAEAIRVARLDLDLRGLATEITTAHIAAVESLLKPGSSGKRVILPGALEVWREYETLSFRRLYSEMEPPYNLEINSTRPKTEAGGFALEIQRGLSVTAFDSVVETNHRNKQSGGLDWMNVALDDQKLPERLLIRARLRGERVCVIDRFRTIALKNLMIDHRIPSSRRATWPIVLTIDGRYIWSPGLPPSLEFAARADSQRLAILRASAI